MRPSAINRGFQDLKVWQKAVTLAEAVYQATTAFPREELFGLTSQLRRAAVSVGANIAEGHGRTTRGEYANHLSVARGSLKEVEGLLVLATRLGFLNAPAASEMNTLCDEISRMLTGLKRHITR